MSATTVNATASSPGWLRSREFDLGFIAAVRHRPYRALSRSIRNCCFRSCWPISGCSATTMVSTFTRLTSTARLLGASLHRAYLPLLVLAGAGDIWARPLVDVSLYFYWQWFHYARQSWGVSQVYRRKAGGIGDNLTVMQIGTSPPLWGIPDRSIGAGDLPDADLPCRRREYWWTSSAAAVPAWPVRGDATAALVAGRLPLAHTFGSLGRIS
jgi:hypothetical protein